MAINNILYQTDYLYNLKSIEKINEIIAVLNNFSLSGEPLFYTTEGVFTDNTTQSGSPLDTPKIVNYGTNKNSNNDKDLRSKLELD